MFRMVILTAAVMVALPDYSVYAQDTSKKSTTEDAIVETPALPEQNAETDNPLPLKDRLPDLPELNAPGEPPVVPPELPPVKELAEIAQKVETAEKKVIAVPVSQAATDPLDVLQQPIQSSVISSELLPPMPEVFIIEDTVAKSNRFTLETGFYLLAPQFSDNPAYRWTSHGTTGYEHFSYGARVSPLIWLGYEGVNGWGGRIRWFEFDQSADTFSFVHPGGGTVFSTPRPLGAVPVVAATPGQTVSFSSGLDVDSLDFEATWSPAFGAGWGLRFGFGGSYRYIQHNYSAYAGCEYVVPDQVTQVTACNSHHGGGKPCWAPRGRPAVIPAGGTRGNPWNNPCASNHGCSTSTVVVVPGQILTGGNSLSSTRTFNGAGPALSVAMERNIGISGLHAYGEGRFTVLFGDTEQRVLRSTIINRKVVAEHLIRDRHDDVIPVGEIELGLGYQRTQGPALLVFRIGFVGQTWWNGGNPIYDGDFGFVGGAFRGGVRY